MKSIFSGLSAKLALALLAVGSMTSCYEKEEVDVKEEVKPNPTYYIVGNVTEASSGKALQVTVQVDGQDVQTDGNGYYRTEVKVNDNVQSFTVVADVKGYIKATKTVTFTQKQDNGIYVETADFALLTPTDAAVEPDPTPIITEDVKEAAEEQRTQVIEDIKTSVVAALPGLTNKDDVQVTVSADDATGEADVVVVAPAEVSNLAVGDSYVAEVPYFAGFDSNITPAYTKAATDGELWIAAAAKYLGKSYGMTEKKQKITLPGKANSTITGFNVTYTYKVETLSFNGIVGVVTYMENYAVEAEVENHGGGSGN